jgi:hypothetical protein
MNDNSRDVRGRLRDDAAEDYELLKGALKSVLLADRPLRRRSEKCQHTNEFAAPDYRARVDAAGKWVEMGFGKPPSDTPDDEVENLTDIAVETMSIEERTALRKRILKSRPDLAAKYGAK